MGSFFYNISLEKHVLIEDCKINTLLPLEQSDRLHMIGLREHIEQCDLLNIKPRFTQSLDIPCQRGGIVKKVSPFSIRTVSRNSFSYLFINKKNC